MLEQVVAVVIRALGKSKKTAPNVLEILLDCLKGKSRETPRLWPDEGAERDHGTVPECDERNRVVRAVKRVSSGSERSCDKPGNCSRAPQVSGRSFAQKPDQGDKGNDRKKRDAQ